MTELLPLFCAASLSHKGGIRVFSHSWEIEGSLAIYFVVKTKVEKVSNKWISTHSYLLPFLCGVLTGIYFSFHCYRNSRKYILLASFFRDGETQSKQ